MAIGTKVKIGFDASAVKGGLSGMSNLFKGAFRGLHQVGIGAARHAGVGIMEMIGKVLMAGPDLADYAGDMVDFSARTRVSIADLVVMENALENAGAKSADTSRMLQMLADNLYEATQNIGPARAALEKLGFSGAEFVNLPLDKAFEKIGKKVGTLPDDFEGIESVMSDLFGAKGGLRMISFFRDFNGGMAQANKNARPFADDLGKNAAMLDELSEKAAAWKYAWKSFVLQGMKTLPPILDMGMKDLGLFDTAKHQEFWSSLGNSFVSGIKALKNGELPSLIADLFKSAGVQMAEGFKSAFGSGGGSGGGIIDLIKSISGFGGSPQSSKTKDNTTAMISKIDRSNQLLQQLVTKKGGWA